MGEAGSVDAREAGFCRDGRGYDAVVQSTDGKSGTLSVNLICRLDEDNACRWASDDWTCEQGQVRSGQVYYSAEV